MALLSNSNCSKPITNKVVLTFSRLTSIPCAYFEASHLRCSQSQFCLAHLLPTKTSLGLITGYYSSYRHQFFQPDGRSASTAQPTKILLSDKIPYLPAGWNRCSMRTLIEALSCSNGIRDHQPFANTRMHRNLVGEQKGFFNGAFQTFQPVWHERCNIIFCQPTHHHSTSRK